MPGLSRLDLSLTRITDHGLQDLKGAPGIADLNLRYAEFVTDEGMMAVRNWKHLRRLNLRGTKITDTTLQHLASVPSLESLDIGFVQLTDVGLDQLTSLPKLHELTIGGNKLSDAGLQSLRQMPGLTYLDLSGAQRTDSGLWSVSVTESGLEAIATLQNLRCLRMNGTSVSPRGLEKLKSLSKLERLDLQGCKRLNDEAVNTLKSFPALRSVDVTGTGMTEKGIAALRQSKPDCKVVVGKTTLPAPSDDDDE